MSSSLETTRDPAVEEEQRLRARTDELQLELAAATAEFEELRITLSAFEARYDARIGVLIVELDRLSVQIAEYERRIAALSEPVETWEKVEEEIKQSFRAEHERIEQETHDAQQASRRAERLPPDPPDAVKADLRALYRKLARQYHPDLAKTASERGANEAAMRRINSAYEAHDIDALQRLEAELPARDGSFPGETASARIAWAVAQIGRLEQTLASIIGMIAQVKATDRYRLNEQTQADPSLLSRLESAYQADLEDRRNRLEELVTLYRNGVNEQLSSEPARS